MSSDFCAEESRSTFFGGGGKLFLSTFPLLPDRRDPRDQIRLAPNRNFFSGEEGARARWGRIRPLFQVFW